MAGLRFRSWTLLVLPLLVLPTLPERLASQKPEDVGLEQVQSRVRAASAAHPRLLLNATQFAELKQRVQTDPDARELYAVIHRQAEAMLGLEPVQHLVVGRRLLGQSRTAVGRVLTLALVHRLSGDVRFLDAAKREMLAAASFPDWNPSHFLDTAEMSFALAIGYDWLYDGLSATERSTIARALREKGLDASFKHTGWVKSTNNWGQVCHGGITAAALALLEHDRELAARVVHRAVTSVPFSMRSYAPDGTYPEGPGYWAYGTTYNLILIAEMESALGTDFGLTGMPGFDQTASYINHATGPSKRFFNYADGSDHRGPLAALQWFSRRYDRPDWLIFENQVLREYLSSDRPLQAARGSGPWLFPLSLVWMPAPRPAGSIQMGLHWLARGHIPVAMHRSSWTDPGALYVGIKAGTAAASHGQMDAGSFVLDADGLRWAFDLGAESYDRIESRGMDLWGRGQDSDRWRVFRNNNRAHSTLVIDGQLQKVDGEATVVKHSESSDFPHTVVDLSPVYEGQATRVLRGIGLVGGRDVLVRDELQGLGGKTVRWAMVTEAEVVIRGPREASLRQGDRELTLRLLEPAGARLQVFDIATPPAEHDSPNPNARMIGFTASASGDASLPLSVLLTRGSVGDPAGSALRPRPLAEW